MEKGTPRELKPIAEQVLAWVARQRELHNPPEPIHGYPVRRIGLVNKDHLRRIELCALVAMNVANFADLYDLQNLEQLLGTDLSEKVDEERKQDDSSEELKGLLDEV